MKIGPTETKPIETKMTQCEQLADQIRRAFEGEAWHGDSVLEILRGVSARMAAQRPIPLAHSIWELVLHMEAWDKIVTCRANGQAVEPSDEQNFPPVLDTNEAGWQKTLASLRSTHAELVETVARFPEVRLHERVPGKDEDYYNFYYMFSGIAQHQLYHAGQIALLKKFG